MTIKNFKLKVVYAQVRYFVFFEITKKLTSQTAYIDNDDNNKGFIGQSVGGQITISSYQPNISDENN